MKNLQVGNIKIGKNKCVIIAEAGVNHNCNLRMARRLIKKQKKMVRILLSFKLTKLINYQ